MFMLKVPAISTAFEKYPVDKTGRKVIYQVYSQGARLEADSIKLSKILEKMTARSILQSGIQRTHYRLSKYSLLCSIFSRFVLRS